MNEITSFNALFVEAARAGLLLQAFYQLPNRRWLASWRRGSGPRATHYPLAEHERPFDALLKAFIMAFGAIEIDPTMPRDEVKITSADGSVTLIKNVAPIDDDLFA